MRIFIQTLKGDKLILENVDPNDTIKDIKAKISDKKAITSASIALFFTGKQLDDESSLSIYNIQRDATLIMAIKMEEGVKITFKIHYQTQWGQILAIIGNIDELGSNRGNKAFKLNGNNVIFNNFVILLIRDITGLEACGLIGKM